MRPEFRNVRLPVGVKSRSVEPICLKSIFGVQRDISFRVGVNSISKVNEMIYKKKLFKTE